MLSWWECGGEYGDLRSWGGGVGRDLEAYMKGDRKKIYALVVFLAITPVNSDWQEIDENMKEGMETETQDFVEEQSY
jgi:hypothetical protein